jgi:hypothetical protein
MSTGAIIFAQNNSSIDYIKLAVFAAERISKYIEIPVSLITDNKSWLEKNYPNHMFEQIIELDNLPSNQQKKFHDGSMAHKFLEWKNHSRSQIYNLTPYDTTLVIDSDYIINSNTLKSALDRDHDLQIYKNSFDLTDWRSVDEFKRINQYSVPFYWATTFIFQKNDIMENFFNLIEYIKSNWNYFRILYNIVSNTYRNDFAFSIAIHIMNGKTNGNFAVELPGKMVYATDRDILVDAIDNKMKFLVEKKNHFGEYILAKTEGLDVHVMNKYSLDRVITGDTNV